MFSSCVIRLGNSYLSMKIPVTSPPRATRSRVKPKYVKISSQYYRRMGYPEGYVFSVGSDEVTLTLIMEVLRNNFSTKN